MADLAEVSLAEAEQDRPVELGVAADEVLLVRGELLAVLVEPVLAGEVALLQEDLGRVPVLGLATQIGAALEHKDFLARRRKLMQHRPTAGTGSDDDHVVVLRGHDGSSPQTRAIGAVQAPVAPRNLGWVRTRQNSRTPCSASCARSRFSATNTPWSTFSVCGTSNGRAASSGGTGP